MPDLDDLYEAIEQYRDVFQDLPTIIGLPEDVIPKVAAILREAVKDGQFLSDAELLKKLDIDPTPSGVVI